MPEKNQSASNREIVIADGYASFLADLKDRVRKARFRAALSVNRELILLYWQIGRGIAEKQRNSAWGAKVIARLAKDLKSEFPEMKGFSPRNLIYMQTFAQAYASEEFLQQFAAQIPWFHNCLILDKISNQQEREWYIRKTIENGWSRAVLVVQIESGLSRRQGMALTNFSHTLPEPQSDLAQQVLKDPYSFDFLGIGEASSERELEHSLILHVRKFLLELGVGFAFVGQQYHLEVAEQDFYIDLLFYHLKLRCYVVIELKAVEFQPEFAGKINFYLSAVDELLRHPDDMPSIGIILCKNKNKIVAEYSLRDTNRPIGVSSYQLTESLPEALSGSLPSIEQLESELKVLPADK
ncbi:MAG: PDDEXK nuclease domain-containing protein [Candidatus Obscuribacterales bacterium]|nr:PDDEXK nuclease domain-containing protein [Candidatus Obscuribacterales bacterium]